MIEIIGDDAITWDRASTMETWVRKMINEGKTEMIVKLMNTLPLDSPLRKKYRDIWSDEIAKKKVMK